MVTRYETKENTQKETYSYSNTESQVSRKLNNFFKRAVDIIASAIGLLFLSPIFGLIAIAIKRDSPGPVFYKGTRIGRFGEPFKIIKFRTMFERPDCYSGSKLTANGDSRITPLGGWLRDTKLNELPQLWNVLIGEMSLVGPRPEVADFVEEWPEKVKGKILSVRPGMTSPASIMYRDEEKQLNGSNFLDDYLKEIMPDKMRLDLLYVDNHTFTTDLDVIFLTLLAVVPNIKKTPFKERTIFSGPIYNFVYQHLTWFLTDFVIAFFAMALSGLVWRTQSPINLGFGSALAIAYLVAFLLSLIGTIFGLHRIVWRYASPVLVLDIGLVVTLTSLILVLLNNFWMDRIVFPANFVMNFGLLTFMGMVTIRYRDRLITGVATRWANARKGRKTFGEPVLVVGAGDGGELAVWILRKS
jgi:lipopolysaccharide/colanic/teichoic acid biosynthesis glycosyltransferase